jgi:hypothetical protein
MIPIRIKQFPKFVRQVWSRNQVLQQPNAENPTFHLCFFSCQSYFKYLYCSLHSLVYQTHGIRFNVLIFSDEDMPLSQEQINAIQALIPSARVIPWPKSMGWGTTQIRWIWRAYGLAAETAASNDVIARIDSDVFFFNDRIFRAVARSDADLVGDGHFVNFEYCQGGCYFFRASAVNKITEMLNREPIENILTEVSTVVEDVAAFHFAKRLELKTWLTWFMMFPDELRNAGGLTKWQRFKFSCAHFVMRNKDAMLEAYEREILQGDVPKSYREALDIQ